MDPDVVPFPDLMNSIGFRQNPIGSYRIRLGSDKIRLSDLIIWADGCCETATHFEDNSNLVFDTLSSFYAKFNNPYFFQFKSNC
jgi:hypothetical protein